MSYLVAEFVSVELLVLKSEVSDNRLSHQNKEKLRENAKI